MPAVAVLCCAGFLAVAAAADFAVYESALRDGDPAALAALLRTHGPSTPVSQRNETVLHHATSYHHAKSMARMVEVLLAAGVPVDPVDDRGRTPLHWAAGTGCTECVTLLLRAGASVAATRRDGATPLHHAASDAAAVLLAAGADPRARDGVGRVPLHTSYEARHPGLLQAGVNARDRHGLTPLHYAALDGNEEKIAWLLAEGADPKLETTAPYHWNGDEPPGAFVTRHLFEAGARAYDMAKWQHDQTKWSTGRYARPLALLDKATPRRGWLSR